MRRFDIRFWLAAAPAILLAGCGGLGTVNQGQVIGYQRDTGMVTLIADSNYRDPAHPRFDMLPPVTIQSPENPKEMGPAPAAGKLLRVDSSGRRLSIFNEASGRIEEVAYTEVASQAGCAAAPVVDRERKTTTICIEGKSTTIAVAEQYLALPADTWKVGDEVRYYYKESARALRMMNVTKTK
jgi:hypothetical protein